MCIQAARTDQRGIDLRMRTIDRADDLEFEEVRQQAVRDIENGSHLAPVVRVARHERAIGVLEHTYEPVVVVAGALSRPEADELGICENAGGRRRDEVEAVGLVEFADEVADVRSFSRAGGAFENCQAGSLGLQEVDEGFVFLGKPLAVEEVRFCLIQLVAVLKRDAFGVDALARKGEEVVAAEICFRRHRVFVRKIRGNIFGGFDIRRVNGEVAPFNMKEDSIVLCDDEVSPVDACICGVAVGAEKPILLIEENAMEVPIPISHAEAVGGFDPVGGYDGNRRGRAEGRGKHRYVRKVAGEFDLRLRRARSCLFNGGLLFDCGGERVPCLPALVGRGFVLIHKCGFFLEGMGFYFFCLARVGAASVAVGSPSGGSGLKRWASGSGDWASFNTPSSRRSGSKRRNPAISCTGRYSPM